MTGPVRLTETGVGIVALSWEPGVSADLLEAAVGQAAGEALSSGFRRVEVAVPAADRRARRAVLRSGFRLEGIRRAVLEHPGGRFDDLVLYARLAEDLVGGPHGFSGVMNTVLPRKRLIAHVLIRDAAGRVLLCDTAFKSDWELPGGIVEPGETPRHGAIREVREELGIELAVGPLLVADWLPPYLGWDDAVELIFDGGLVEPADLASFALQENEILRVELVGLDRAAELVTPLAHRRLGVALRQRAGQTAYLEDGRPVGPDVGQLAQEDRP